MKKNKKKQSLLIIALVAVVGIMSVVFALNATTTLTANGAVTVPYEKWDIEFSPDENDETLACSVAYKDGHVLDGGVVATLGDDSTQGTNTVVNYTLGIDEVGLEYKVAFMIENKGTLAAGVAANPTTGVPDDAGVTVAETILSDLEDGESVVESIEPGDYAWLVVTVTVDNGANVGNKTIGVAPENSEEPAVLQLSTELVATYVESALGA